MPITRPKPPRTEDERLTKGVYLTDVSEDPKGRGLFRVLEVVELSVELENCMVPSGVPQWMPVGEVLRRLRLVRPEV